MSFYSDLIATVSSMMTEFGQTVTIQQNGPMVTQPNGVTAPSQPAPMVTKGVIFDYQFRAYGNEVEKKNYIQSADKQLFIAPTEFTPQVQDKVYVANNWWAIVNIKQVNPAGTPVLYELWLKR